jgi:hypothetical protein
MRLAALPFVVFLLLLCAGTSSAQFCGSAKSDIYHRNSCTHAGRISAANRIEFKTAAEAEAAGRIPCKTCRPEPAGNDHQARPDSSSTAPPSMTPAVLTGQSNAQPAASGRCTAMTRKGTQCRRNSEPGSKYCWQHAQ